MNNNQIHNTSYYQLPSGRQLEDFIEDYSLSFAIGSAVKYLWRAGNKDGEPADKDRSKAEHFIALEAKRQGVEYDYIANYVKHLIELAKMDYVGIPYFMHQKMVRIGRSYNDAVKRHPYFADHFFIADRIKPSEALKVVEEEKKKNAEIGNVDTMDVLKCEVMGIYAAMENYNEELAIRKCYQSIAVTLRMIDVIEGRQALGNPCKSKEEKAANNG